VRRREGDRVAMARVRNETMKKKVRKRMRRRKNENERAGGSGEKQGTRIDAAQRPKLESRSIHGLRARSGNEQE
jgi:hypothetical protein